MMESAKTKPGAQEQPLSCYRLWIKPKSAKKADKRSYPVLGQYLLGTKK
jgi:hypothetical protein